jgi:signal transduction histidine kinase/ligand-binding sensor domain-containing protein/DNA-binding response OmpR family regulator
LASKKGILYILRHIIGIFFLSLSFSVGASCQVTALKYDVYTIDNGLSQNMVQAVCEDRQGFMWFGTKDGLNRFDGHNFVVYRNEPGNTKSLSNNDVTAIYEDKNQNLWVGTNLGGLNLFDRQSGCFYTLPEVAVQDNISRAKMVVSITEDKTGDIWVTNDNAIFRISLKDNKARLAPGTNGIIDKYTVSSYLNLTGLNLTRNQTEYVCNNWTYISRDGHVFVTQNFSICRSEKSIYEEREPRFIKMLDQRGNGIVEDRNGRIWFSSLAGIFKYNPVTKALLHYSDPRLSLSHYRNITLGPDGNIWFIEWEGHTARKKFQPFLNYFDVQSGTFGHLGPVEEINACCIYMGSRQLIWLGSAGNGVLKFNLRARQFKLHKDDIMTTFSKKNLEMDYIFYQNYSYTLIKKPGNNKLFLYNWITDSVYPAEKIKDLVRGSGLPGFRSFISMVHQAYIRNNGDIWALSANYVDLVKIDLSGRVLKTIACDSDLSLIFFEDRKGRFWAGNKLGTIFLLNKNEDRLIGYEYNPKSEFRSDLQVYIDDKDGNLWLGTIYGLIKFNPDTRKSIFLGDHDKRLSSSILSLCFDPLDPDHILWAGTEGGGLLRINISDGSVKQLLAKQGLPSEVVYAIMPDKNHNLWLSTNNGLSCLNPVTYTFTNFKKEDGLQSNEFNRLCYSKSKDGTLMFGGLYGLNYFKPETITRDTTPPKIAFTGFKIFNKYVHFGKKGDYLDQPIEFTKSIVLPWDQNMVNLDFAAFDFTGPDLVNYSWKMEGLDKDWINAGKGHSATYANLSPGKYIFRLKASNGAGYWTKNGLSLSITILPPWWLTWWAYSLYALATAGLIFGIFRFRLNRLRLHDALKQEQQEAQRLQENDEMKTRFFSNITHEFRTPLTLILGPVERLLAQVKDKETRAELSRVERNARQLLRLINQLLDLNKLESKNMNVETSTFDAVLFLKEITDSFHAGAATKGITISFQTKLVAFNISCDADKVQKIISNLLSNALKFTGKNGRIDVMIESVDENNVVMLEIRVKDTGIGIAKDQQDRIFDRFYQADSSQTRKGEGTGIGLSLVKELVALMDGSVHLESEPGIGSQFTVKLPVNPIMEAISGVKAMVMEREKEVIPFAGIGELTGEDFQETGSEKPKVLIIEDNADMRDYIKICIGREYDILEAANGKEGTIKAFDHIPDLVISDIMMPEKDGYEVTETIKQDERTSHIPVILLTAKTTIDSRIKGLKTKADLYLSKPFNADELLLNIQNLISIRKELRDRYSGDLKELSELATKNREDKFILKLSEIIEKNIDKMDFGVEELSFEAHMSRAQLHRKITALTGNNTTYFIKRIRLEKAMKLLTEDTLSISEIAYSVGFNTPNYFSKCFHEYYGFAPGQVLKKG